MTKREKQLYKSGRKNINGYKKKPILFRIKYNKKFLVYTILIIVTFTIIAIIIVICILNVIQHKKNNRPLQLGSKGLSMLRR